MNEYTPYLSPQIGAFITFREVSENWNQTYGQKLHLFDQYCLKNYPDADILTQEMVDGWCKQRNTETNNSCRARVYPIYDFIQYLRGRGGTTINTPILPRHEPTTHIPHTFTERELSNFFNACDKLPSIPRTPAIRARKITVPVFFRLLYSSGIRTFEARMLRTVDVDLEGGILDIRQSKGHSQHYVVLHDSMLTLLRQYDEAISKLYPDRKCFFPAEKDRFHKRDWVSMNFRKIWDTVNDFHAIPYDFRHNYAIHNINGWIDEGFDFDEKLLNLSKSMGHRGIESTTYYYSIVPKLADILAEKTNFGFEAIVPEVYDEEIK